MVNRYFAQMRWFCLAAALVILAVSPRATRAVALGGPSAAAILHRAEAQARAGHKNILLEFGASWCVNCKLYDRLLAAPAMHAILSHAFVFATMDTGENLNDTRYANTPGGVAFENSVGGKNAGWPFLVILNAQGKPIVDSYCPDAKSKSGKANIGYPVLPQEINWFMVMMRKGDPSLSQADQAKLRAWLTSQASKIGGLAGEDPNATGTKITDPVVIYAPHPKFTNPSREAKYSGTVVLWVTVGVDGRVYDIQVARRLAVDAAGRRFVFPLPGRAPGSANGLTGCWRRRWRSL